MEEASDLNKEKREDIEAKDGDLGASEKMDVTEQQVEPMDAVDQEKKEAKPPKTPLHATRVVYLPYLPLTIHRSTVENVSSVPLKPFFCNCPRNSLF